MTILKKYTIVGGLEFNEGFAKFVDWSEGTDPDDACRNLEAVLYKYNKGLKHWEMDFIFEGHHNDVYPKDD